VRRSAPCPYTTLFRSDGVTFPTPVLAASGTFNAGREMSQLIDLRKVGGIVTKSVTLAPARGLPVPRMAETDSGMLNAIGLQNPRSEEHTSEPQSRSDL